MFQDAFASELDTFRKEEQQGQQFFFSYLTIRTFAYDDPKLLRWLNQAHLLAKTIDYALLKASFIALGRIFDRNGRHNISVLIQVARQNIHVFSRDALADRKRQLGLEEKEIAEYVCDRYVPTSEDFDRLEQEVESYRNIYNPRYKDVRDKIFAHSVYSGVDEINVLLEKTDVDELKRLFGFLHGLHEALYQLYVNGARPIVRLKTFERASRVPRGSRIQGHDPADILVREISRLLESIG
jgi:hypothetical protein